VIKWLSEWRRMSKEERVLRNMTRGMGEEK
jgi:hypothetical protein